MKVIIYELGGNVAVISVAPTIDPLAEGRRVVPRGVPFAIVEASVLPTDRDLRDAWSVDAALLSDGVGEND